MFKKVETLSFYRKTIKFTFNNNLFNNTDDHIIKFVNNHGLDKAYHQYNRP